MSDLNERQVIALERIARVLQGMYRICAVAMSGAPYIFAREKITPEVMVEIDTKAREHFPAAFEGIE